MVEVETLESGIEGRDGDGVEIDSKHLGTGPALLHELHNKKLEIQRLGCHHLP